MPTRAQKEAACGARYRSEVSDLGLGCTKLAMQQQLRTWGYAAALKACQEWLSRYRLGPRGVDGNNSIYVLSRQDLQRWYYVDGLRGADLQQKYLQEHGIWAYCSNLVRWLKAPAQALSILENNEDLHTHACGEYVLEQLQKGVDGQTVADEILSKYLVRTTRQRVQAYRHYREQMGSYWTPEKLEY